MTDYEDDAREFVDDPRVKVTQPGEYVVDLNGVRFLVKATMDLDWIIVTADQAPKGRAVTGFAAADDAIRFVLGEPSRAAA